MKRFLLLMVLITPLLLQALTIDEAVGMALDNNPDMQTARNNKEIAYADYRSTKGILFPQIDAIGSFSQTTNELSNSASAAYGADKTKETMLAGSLQASQILFSSSVFLGLKAAGVYTDLQKQNVKLTEENVLFQTYSLFDTVLLAQEVYSVQQEALGIARKHYQQVETMYNSELISEYDLLRAELAVAELEPQVSESDKNLQLALESLKNHIGWDEGELELEGSIAEVTPEAIELSGAISEGVDNRNELQIAGLSRDMREINYRNESLYFLPSIQATAGYTHYAGSDSYSLEGDDVGDTYNWGVSLRLPIFAGMSNHYGKKKAHYQYKNAMVQENNLKDMIELEITNAYKSFQTSNETLATQRKNVSLAEKGLRIASTRYANHVGTQLEVSDAQLTWRSVKLSYLNALYMAKINWLSLKKAMGREL